MEPKSNEGHETNQTRAGNTNGTTRSFQFHMIFSRMKWLIQMSGFIQSKGESTAFNKTVLFNTAWLIGDNLLRLVIGLLIGIWMARYLGPEQFGFLNFIIAIVAMFGVAANFGLNGIVVRDLVKDLHSSASTLGTAFCIQIIGALLAFTLCVTSIAFIRSDDLVAKLSVLILSSALFFRASDVVKYWFEARVESRYVVKAESAILLFVAMVKALLIVVGAPLMAFIWAIFLEGLLIAIGLFVTYQLRVGNLRFWVFSATRAKQLFRDSWPLVLASVAVILYMRIDQIMLGQLLGDRSVGLYSAAIQISQVWYFIPVAIVASVFPRIVAVKGQEASSYLSTFQQLFRVLLILSVIIALPVTFLSDWLIETAFGSEYRGAGLVLAIHVWAGVFVGLNVASGKWFLMENLQGLLLARHLLGALINVALNFLWIPKFGIAGAAWATLCTYAAVVILFNVFNFRTRSLLRLYLGTLGINKLDEY